MHFSRFPFLAILGWLRHSREYEEGKGVSAGDFMIVFLSFLVSIHFCLDGGCKHSNLRLGETGLWCNKSTDIGQSA